MSGPLEPGMRFARRGEADPADAATVRPPMDDAERAELYRALGDPSVEMWRESTSARLRRVEAELGSALGALATARARNAELVAACDALGRDLAAALIANDQLGRRLP